MPLHRIAVLIGCAGWLSACAGPIVWDRPGTTPQQLSMDNARCRMMAEDAAPDVDVGTISTGKFGRDLALNAAAGFIGALAQSAAVQRRFQLCMEANGYVARAPGAPVIAAAGGGAPPTPPLGPADVVGPVPAAAAPMIAAAAPPPPHFAQAGFPAPPPFCPPPFNPRWSVPYDGQGLILMCLEGNRVGSRLWRENGNSFYY